MFLSYCKNSSFGFVFWACLLKENTIYYLHVFLFVGSNDKSHCTELAKYLQTLCQQLGIPIILTKVRVLQANFLGSAYRHCNTKYLYPNS